MTLFSIFLILFIYSNSCTQFSYSFSSHSVIALPKMLNIPSIQRNRETASNNMIINMQSSLTNDEGVLKLTSIKESSNSNSGRKIEAGDILAIQYVAKVKDSDDIFAKNEQEKIIAFDGSMIKGWDVALQSMTVGEEAKFSISSQYAYGTKNIGSIIPSNADIEIEMKVLAWLGNQLRPESLFQKDLDIDPFIASTPESIRAEYEEMQVNKENKYEGSIFEIYLRRLKNISFGFGGSNFFASQSGEAAPWYLNPNLTFPAMILIVVAAFATVLSTGSVKEKGRSQLDLETASIIKYEAIPTSRRDIV